MSRSLKVDGNNIKVGNLLSNYQLVAFDLDSHCLRLHVVAIANHTSYSELNTAFKANSSRR